MQWMRSCGGMAVTLECGQHDDPQGPQVAYQAILSTLAQLKMLPSHTALPTPQQYEHITLCQVVDKHHNDDIFIKPWKSFDFVQQGELIGLRADGSQVCASMTGLLVFPNSTALAGQEWFYMASQRTCFVN